MVEGLANGSVVNGTSVRTLLRQIDKELKRLLDQGADGINQPAPEELVKNLLFYIAKAPAQSPRIRALKEQYRLDEALPDTDVVDEERARLAGPDRDAMRSVVAALCEELVRVRTAWTSSCAATVAASPSWMACWPRSSRSPIPSPCSASASRAG